MRDGHAIFDMVVHVHNTIHENWKTRDGQIAQPWLYRFTTTMRRGIVDVPPKEVLYSTPWSAERIRDMIFHDGSQIDYAMVQVVPLFELWAEDPEDAINRPYTLAKLEPRVIFCGGTDPVIRGLNRALKDIEHQITDMGARSIKFYNAHSSGRSWRMDDKNIAYPMYEKMLELGVNLAQVHKGDPQGLEPMTALQAHDVAEAAIDFPEMNFVVHHLGFPYDDETIAIAARFPNIYLAMSTWINMIKFAPEPTAMRWGKALFWCGPEKLLWGSETPLWPDTQRLLDLCWNFQMPDHLIDGWGFPEITDEDRYKMFGGNMLRLLGMSETVPATVASSSR